MASEASVLNLSAFSNEELSALLTAAKAEVLTRLTGRIVSGAGTGSSYTMTLYSNEDLNRLVNALTEKLGLDTDMTFARPNFSGCGATSNPYTGL